MVTIWGSIVHLSDEFFAGEGDYFLNNLICSHLIRMTANRQTWMINPAWSKDGALPRLLHKSYPQMKGSVESYLVLVTSGFADIVNNVSDNDFKDALHQMCMRAKSFDKSVIGVVLGVPSKCPIEPAEKIKRFNEIIKAAIKEHRGYLVDLSEETYSEWSGKGSKLLKPNSAAEKIAKVVMECHPGLNAWKAIHK